MEVESKGRERKNEKKFLMIVLGSLCFIAVILIVIIVIVANLPKNGSGSNTVEGETVAEEVAPDYAQIAASHEEYLKATENINSVFAEDVLHSLDEVLGIYQQYIDSAENEYVKDMLRIDYYSVIKGYDVNKTRGDEVINGLLAVDERLKSVSSAVAVLVTAKYYERADLAQQYTNILNERQAAAGIDTEMKTEG